MQSLALTPRHVPAQTMLGLRAALMQLRREYPLPRSRGIGLRPSSFKAGKKSSSSAGVTAPKPATSQTVQHGTKPRIAPFALPAGTTPNAIQAEPSRRPASSTPSGPDTSKTADEDNEPKGPQPLRRPLGLATAPETGENTGIDPRDWRTRRDDFLNYDKHLERRKELTAEVAKPYFRDWKNMRTAQGKVFIAPTRVFRADKARFFPNLRGITAADASEDHDTTPILTGRVSIVSIYTGTWAQRQTASWVGENAKLMQMLAKSQEAGNTGSASPSASSSSTTTVTTPAMEPSFFQHVDLNLEPNRMRYALVRWFLGRQRRSLPASQWARYFVVHKGFTERVRNALGMHNASVGYVFLLDAACRVRWAGSAAGAPDEVASLNRAVVRLGREYLKAVEEQKKTEEAAEEAAFFNTWGIWFDPRVVADVVEGMGVLLEE